MSTVGDFLKKSSHYLIGTAATLVSGLISFPLFTRMLSQDDYGVMALIAGVMLGGIAATKLGLQNSIIRMWSLHEAEGGALVRTFAVAQSLVGAICAAVVGAVALGILSFEGGSLALPLAIASLLIPIRALYSLTQSLMRSRDKSLAYAAIAVCNQFGGLACAIVAVVTLKLGLAGFYGAFAIAEGLTVGIALWLSARGSGALHARFSRPLLVEGLRFGVPMIAFELGVVMLVTSDRFVLDYFWDHRTVGLYAVASSLAMQLQYLMVFPIELAALPMLSRIYDKEGREKTQEFLGRAIKLWWTGAAPVVAGLWAVRRDLMVLLASPKYAEASALTPILLGAFLIFGSRPFLAAGLFLTKKTMRMAAIAAAGAVLNLGLNIALVPRWGSHGSAVATLISVTAIVAVLAWAARAELPFALGWFSLGRAAVGATGMALAVMQLPLSDATGPLSAASHLGLRVAAGGAIYAIWVLVTDPELRRVVTRRAA